jgi:hypothetical protein
MTPQSTPGASPVPGIDPTDADPKQAAPDTQPGMVEFDIHVKAAPDELEQAVALLKEAGLDTIAADIEKALKPEGADDQGSLDDSTNELTDSISAMGNNPHGA